MIAPELVALRARLDAVGVVVVQEPEYLTIRLPFFCSVRVTFVDGRLRFEGFFGPASRVKSSTIRLTIIALIAASLAKFGPAYAGTMAVIAVLAAIYDVLRWMITEQAITRATIVAATQPLPGVTPGSLGEGNPSSVAPRTLDYVDARKTP